MCVATLVIGLVMISGCSPALSMGWGLWSVAGRRPVGLLIAGPYLVGATFALAVPLVSGVAFALGGLLGLATGATTPFCDLTIWGVVSPGLAGLSRLDERERRGRRRARGALTVGASPRQAAGHRDLLAGRCRRPAEWAWDRPGWHAPGEMAKGLGIVREDTRS